MKSILIYLALVVSVSLTGQVRPSDFPALGTISDANFEVYSQFGGVNTKAAPSAFRAFSAPILYLSEPSDPTATGNPSQYHGNIVEGPTGNVFYVDYAGRGLRLNPDDTYYGSYINHSEAAVNSVPIGGKYKAATNNTMGLAPGQPVIRTK